MLSCCRRHPDGNPPISRESPNQTGIPRPDRNPLTRRALTLDATIVKDKLFTYSDLIGFFNLYGSRRQDCLVTIIVTMMDNSENNIVHDDDVDGGGSRNVMIVKKSGDDDDDDDDDVDDDD
ncbi:hypothetical protein ElyMa_001705600 [Elysia marginata]|uniref:Uncharacterized protein n=1 Tax=Elysia marginata TaxID=1093978 RepID=A0AAV4JWI2_9GAST|nr:hypothetical protein ElyMa_001705600 [Elysia marginata]